ncbi:MAG: YqjF family protein [Gemmatimonadales bacterium]
MKNGRPFLTAEWRYLAMLNWEIAPEVLRPLVPHGTQLDPFLGRTFVSLVGFRFLHTHLLGIPLPFHRHFDEVNLRFYVRRDGPEGMRHGVVFVSELVPRPAVTWLARVLFNEPYRTVRMRHRVDSGLARRGDHGVVEYGWHHGGRWHGLAVQTTGGPELPVAGSEAEFITEHHWGYTAQPNGSSLEYEVAHPPWPVWKVRNARLDCDVTAVYGPAFAEALRGEPHSAFVAQGSAVAVGRPRRLPPQVF